MIKVIGVDIIIGEDCDIDDDVIIGYNKISKIRELYNNSVIIGDRTVIKSGTIIYVGAVIGKNNFIGHHVIIRENTTLGDNNVIGHFNQIEGNCFIGNGCTIFSQCHLTSYSFIGNNVFMAPFCCTTNDLKIRFKRPQLGEEPFIGTKILDNVRIAAGCMFAPGIIIGKEAVIGLGSIVTKDVPEGQIFYGNPAHFVREIDKREFIQ